MVNEQVEDPLAPKSDSTPTLGQEQTERKPVGEQLILVGCAVLGSLAFVILNSTTGAVPGGMIGGAVGGGIGAALGFIINTIRE